MIVLEPNGSLAHQGAFGLVDNLVSPAQLEPRQELDSTQSTPWTQVDGVETGSTNETYLMQTAPVALRHTVAPTSLEVVYAEQHDRMVVYLQRLVGDRATAEDLLHDTFVKALRGWSSRHRDASTNAWLYRIAKNTAYDELRRRRRAREASLTDEMVADMARPSFDDRVVDADAVRRALARVPRVFRAPLLLHVYRSQRIDEIADQLNVAVGTVKSRLHRGRAHFRRAYDVNRRT